MVMFALRLNIDVCMIKNIQYNIFYGTQPVSCTVEWHHTGKTNIPNSIHCATVQLLCCVYICECFVLLDMCVHFRKVRRTFLYTYIFCMLCSMCRSNHKNLNNLIYFYSISSQVKYDMCWLSRCYFSHSKMTMIVVMMMKSKKRRKNGITFHVNNKIKLKLSF